MTRRLPPLTIAIATVAAASVPTVAAATSGDSAPSTLPSGDLTVFAAASLTGAFDEIGAVFEVAYPDVDITFSYAASSELVSQIIEGAPADVLASADVKNMDKLVEAGANGGEPQTFATNSLEIIVEPGNPEGVTGIGFLADNSELIVVSCAPEVPIGGYTQDVFDAARVDVEIDSFEENVKAVVSKVELGEADAGIVYASDVAASGDKTEGVEIPADLNVIAHYPIAPTLDAANPEAASAFIAFVIGNVGQEILDEFGFGPIDAAAPSGSLPADSAA